MLKTSLQRILGQRARIIPHVVTHSAVCSCAVVIIDEDGRPIPAVVWLSPLGSPPIDHVFVTVRVRQFTPKSKKYKGVWYQMAKPKIDERAALKAIESDPDVKAEFSRIESLFENMPEQSHKLLRPLIARASFVAVLIDRLEADLLKNGWQQQYVNGKDQSGWKKSTSADLHATYTKIYAGIMKQLYSSSGFGESGSAEEEDEFDRWEREQSKRLAESQKEWERQHKAHMEATGQNEDEIDEFD